MELVPKVPSERVAQGLQWAAAGFILALAASCGVYGALVFVAGAGTFFLLRRTLSAADLRQEGALDRFECIAALVARAIAVTALVAFALGGTFARVFAMASFACAIGLTVVTLLRDRKRARFFERVYAGDDPEFRIERDDEARGFELLPPALSGTLTDAVIAHVSATSNYRTNGPRPLARVMRSFSKMRARLSKRRRTLTMTVVGTSAAWTLVLAGPFMLVRSQPPVARAASVAPACVDAVPYFEERLQSITNVGRATLIAHGTSGEVVYVPKAGSKASFELDAEVLETARAIPCRDKLTLTIAQPRYVAFDVSAELAIEEGANETAVQRDAEEQVRALFQPDAHALDTQHFGFGATEKTFGYRVRHALRHVSGVKAVKLVVDGADREVPLEPTDFPTLKSLSIGVVR